MKIAFAGFRHGHIYGLYNKVAQTDTLELAGCFEEDEDARQSTKKVLNIDFNYHSYEEILNDPLIDIVAIGDYFSKRGQMVIQALQAGKHVICDKPICTDLTELDQIEALSKEKHLQVCSMLDLRYLPQIPKVCEILKSGKLGKIVNISFTGQHCLNYGERAGWYFEPGKQGGTINDIAIHGIDLVHLLTGKKLTKVNCAKTWNAFADQEPDFKDCAQFMVEMEDISIMADVSYAAPKYQGKLPTYWDFYFWGTKGMLKFNLTDNNIYLYRSTEEVITCAPATTNYLQDLLSEIKGEKTIMNTQGIIDSQRMTLKIQKASEK